MQPFSSTAQCRQWVRLGFVFVSIFLLVLFNITLVSAAAADPFSGASPAFNAAPAEATNYNLGDWGVADEKGVATYTFPIAVPPGRNGMAPQLALRYSSESPLRGGVAVGWTLDIPKIEIDYSLGFEEEPFYKASFNSASGRLVPVDDVLPYDDARAFRIDFDNAFIRVFRRVEAVGSGIFRIFLAYWTALTQDGVRHHFSKQLLVDPHPRWYIEKQEDPFGNTVEYLWSDVKLADGSVIDRSLSLVRYSANEAAGLIPHAKVEFEYSPLDLCPGSTIPIGAAARSGAFGVDGAQKLTAIETYVRDTQASPWRLSRRVDLSYLLDNSILFNNPDIVNPLGADAADAIDCRQNKLRYLTEIAVTAYDRDGNPTEQPPLTFEYNRRINTTGLTEPGTDPLRPITIDSPGYAHDGLSGRDVSGAETTLLDLDGDGVGDRVSVERVGDVCHLVWYRGLLGGAFATSKLSSPLPTALWYHEWKGESNAVASDKEACTLSGQRVFRDSKGQTGAGVLGRGIVSYHFMDFDADGLLDLVLNVWATYCHESHHPKYRVVNVSPPGNIPEECLSAANLQTARAGDAILADDEPPPGGGLSMTPENQLGTALVSTEQNQRQVLRLYRGTGDPNGLFNTAFVTNNPIPIELPAVLPAAADDERLDTQFVQRYPIPVLFDLDQDGFIDVIDTQDVTVEGCTAVNNDILLRACDWRVYFGDGTGSFPARNDAHVWRVPKVTLALGIDALETCSGFQYNSTTTTLAELADFNGDGLPDLLAQLDNGQLVAYWNTGREFATNGQALGHASPLERSQTDCEQTGGEGGLLAGARGYLRRLVDLDGDGLLDMVWFANGNGVDDIASDLHVVSAKFNLGGRLGERVTLPEEWLNAKRLLEATMTPTATDPLVGEWHIATDFTDVTGDGLPDLAAWSGDQLRYISRPGLRAATDRLRAFENGRGLRVEFEYEPSSNKDAVSCTNSSCANARLPHAEWVVTATEVDAGFGQPPLRTEYAYQDPAYLSAAVFTGNAERSRFAGFGWSERTAKDAAGQPLNLVRRHFLYRARGTDNAIVAAPESELSEVWTYRLENGQARLHQYESREFGYRKLFSGQVQVKVLNQIITCRTTGDGMDKDDCLAQPDGVRRIRQIWTGYRPSAWGANALSCDPELGDCPSESNAELFVLTSTLESTALAAQAADRRTTFTYHIRYGQAIAGNQQAADDYRVMRSKQERSVRLAAGGFETTARMITDYADNTGLVWRTRDYFDEATETRTRFTNDLSTGNRISIRKPMQHPALGGSDNRTTFAYDDHQLFVRATTNELGQRVLTWIDVATGALFLREGPNSKSVGNTAVLEQESWRLDGFGRILRHLVSLDHEQSGYRLQTMERFTYDDWRFVNSGEPVTILSEQRRTIGEDVWITNLQALDGSGRVLSSSALWQEEGVAKAAVTTYRYDDRGNLVAIEQPSPADDGQRISFTYAYDVLGRLVAFNQPNNTGVSITYDGLNNERCELTNDNSGGCQLEGYDMLGRLLEVREQDGNQTAVTRYAYDGNDNLAQITDADGNITSLVHDWAGNRIEVRRGSRVWHYTYDLNGNLTAEISPVPPGETADSHSIQYTYDDLDRLLTVQYRDWQIDTFPAPTEPETPGDFAVMLPVLISTPPTIDRMAPAITDAFAPTNVPTTTTFRYTYDQGVNGVGRLSRVEWPFGEVAYGYEARGLLATETRSISLDAPVQLNVTQSVTREYNALGLPTISTWNDGQKWRLNYDQRGLVRQVRWHNPAIGDWQEVADYERNLSGLPRMRHTSFGQSRAFTYDTLGRPLTDVVEVNGSTIAERRYTYSGAGDLAQVSGRTNGVSADAAYSYDQHHRLLTASGPNGYQGQFSYSMAGNVQSASVDWNGSNESRAVDYEYGAVDPQAVDRLTELNSGRIYGRFSYDLSGNMLQRITDAENLVMTWDGQDQIRTVQTVNGSEVYLYDHSGSRILSMNEEDGTRLWFGEMETHFDLSGNQTKKYLHLSVGGGTLARVEDWLNVELQYADALQNLMFSLDSSGNILASFLYGPFGEVVYEEGAEDHRRQFNGKENDAVSGLRYYGFRYYDPLALRWNSADPLYRFVPDLGLAEPQRMNLYTFTLNNPVRFYDPDGRVAFGDDSDIPADDSNPTGNAPYCDDGDYTRFCNNGSDEEDAQEDDEENDGETIPTIVSYGDWLANTVFGTVIALEDKKALGALDKAARVSGGAAVNYKPGGVSKFLESGLGKITAGVAGGISFGFSFYSFVSNLQEGNTVEAVKSGADSAVSAAGVIGTAVSSPIVAKGAALYAVGRTTYEVTRYVDDKTGGAITKSVAWSIETTVKYAPSMQPIRRMLNLP